MFAAAAARPYIAGQMAQSRKHRDRYDLSGNVEAEYVDAEQTVLVNKKGITNLALLQALEEEALARAYEMLFAEVHLNTLLTSDLTGHFHLQIFGELYQWARRWRTVNISKPGITWPPPAFIDQNMATWERDFLRQYPASQLQEDNDFCDAVAQIHRFRESFL